MLGKTGGFTILARRGAFLGTGEDFDLALQFMDIGDELAIKKGGHLLSMTEGVTFGKEDVKSMSVIATGLGILPSLQLLRTVLFDPDSSLSTTEFLWINDCKRDFVLNKDVEELERAVGCESGRLRVTRVVDRELGNPNTLINKELHDSLAAYRPGALGLVLAEGVAAEKMFRLLQSRGYPETSIVRMREPSQHSNPTMSAGTKPC